MVELKEDGKNTLNTVDQECTRINSIHGTHAGYNAQIVTDDKHGLIVSSDAVATNNDLGQFHSQIDKANNEMGKKCDVAVADSGYAWTDDLVKVDEQGIQVIVPSQRIASGKEAGEFDKRNFKYDPVRDCYICPEGAVLVRCGRTKKKNGSRYRIARKQVCLRCQAYGECTTVSRGRVIERLDAEALRERLEKEFAFSENQAIYKRRQQKAELVFGHIKRNLGVNSFLLRGLEGVRAEISLLSLCFNLRRMITLLGITGLIRKLGKRTRLFFIENPLCSLLSDHRYSFIALSLN